MFSNKADTIFLPKSWISPFTVAKIIVAFFSAVPSGNTSLIVVKAACIVSAASITCGKKALPDPNFSPTTAMASDKPLRVTSNGSKPCAKASFTNGTTASFSPCSTACLMHSIGSSLWKASAVAFTFFVTTAFSSSSPYSAIKSAAAGSKPINVRPVIKAFRTISFIGFMIGQVKPLLNAIVKNCAFKYARCGKPKDILDKPITVGNPKVSA